MVLDCRALLPTATLLAPVVLAFKDDTPIATLSSAVVLAAKAVCPTATFDAPVVFASKALRPNAVLLSPVFGELEYDELADWVLKSPLEIQLQVQLHKHIWSPEMTGV